MARLVGLHLRLLLLDERGRAVSSSCCVALPCLRQRAVALEVLLGVGEQRLVLRHLGDRLVERGLKRRRVDLHEEVALLDHLAFLEGDLVDLAVDARADGHRVLACTMPRPLR